MSIKYKIRGTFLLLIVLASAGGICSYIILNKATKYIESKDTAYKAFLLFEDARKLEKNFLLYGRKDVDFLKEGDNEISKKHSSKLDSIHVLLKELKSDAVIHDNNLGTMVYNVRNVVATYQHQFSRLKKLLYSRGFKDYGLEGAMRDQVHELQKCKSDPEKVYAFSLRRHEKDFMLRKDLKYQERLNNTAKAFIQFIRQSDMIHMTPLYKTQTINGIQDYVKKFNELVALEKTIGLSIDSGVLGDLHKSAIAIGPEVDDLLDQLNRLNSELQRRAGIVLLVSILMPLLFGVIASVIFARNFTQPILSLNMAMKRIINGEDGALSKLEQINTRDEIGNLARNFREMMNTIKKHMEEISEKNKALETTAGEEQKRKWIAEGLATFTDLMKNNDGDLNEYAYNFISNLVKYIGANQGGLFFVDDLDEPSKMIQYASHAYDRRKFIEKEIIKGEGLVGAAWLEQEPIIMTDIPQNYVSITSGLGQATPSTLLIMPVMNDDKVLGVIELASFREIDAYQKELIEKVAERLGSTYYSLVTQEKTRQLYMTSQKQSEELKAQEEELRQNMEEMHATHEEMQRKQQESESFRSMLDSIINLIPFPVFVKDERFRYALVNQAEAELYGSLPEEMYDNDDTVFISKNEEIDSIRTSDSEALSSEVEIKLPEQRISFPNGTQKVLETIKLRFMNPITNQYNILGVSLDKTEVHDVKKELHFTREELRKAIESLNDLKSNLDTTETSAWAKA